VAVTEALADAGVEVGSTIELRAGRRTVTGVVQQPYSAYEARSVIGSEQAVGLDRRSRGPQAGRCATG
jgi:hypothetical protein